MVLEEIGWSWRWWVFLGGVAGVVLAVIAADRLPLPGKHGRAEPVLPALVLLLLAGIAVLFRRLRVTLGPAALVVGFGPLRDRVPLARIVRCAPVTYHWLAFGGWGIRYNWAARAKLYNVAGDGGRAVRLTLDDGRHLLFSARDPAAVCAALRPHCPHCRPEPDRDRPPGVVRVG
jgi:hypothetical protein